MLITHMLNALSKITKSTHSYLYFLLLCYCSNSLAALVITPFINEIHYDNSGSDVSEFIEIIGLTGTDITDWSIYLYNGSNGKMLKKYNFAPLTLTDQSNGFGFATIYINGIQNGTPDGIALANAANDLIQFISYEGNFTATNGVAKDQESLDIGVFESSNTPLGFSLQLGGSGSHFDDFFWQYALLNTANEVNINQKLVNAPQNNIKKQNLVQVPEPKNSYLLVISLILMINFRQWEFNRS